MSDSRLLSLDEAAAYLNVGRGTMERLAKERSLPGLTKIGVWWRFSVPVFEAVLASEGAAVVAQRLRLPLPAGWPASEDDD